MRKKLSLLLLLATAINFCCYGQFNTQEESLPRFSIKNNLLYDAMTTLNLGAELRLSRKMTFDVPVSWNPFTFSENRKWKHVSVAPELRYWTCTPFTGHFFGAHLIYAHYNAAKLKLPFELFPELETERWEGDMYGAGLSYGYSWYLSPRLSLEATIGVGYGYFDFDRYECRECGELIASSTRHYFGPTKAALSLIYFIK